MLLEVTEQDIQYAESILFGRIDVFDEDRVEFIKNLNTIDVLAVPGSGKTTALLAKLIILSKKFNFSKGRGILLLSHTNKAVDLIHEKIGHVCPNLFVEPNFIGTIQSFVNKFLTIPYYENRYGVRPDYIDGELYNRRFQESFESFFTPEGFNRPQINLARSYVISNRILTDFRIDFDAEAAIVRRTVSGPPLTFVKPTRKNSRNYQDYTTEEKATIKKWLIAYKIKFWETFRILHYDDAYVLAKRCILKIPSLGNIMKSRFQFVFIDEMQDMERHQVDIIDKIFYDPAKPEYPFQRIGDKNQSIYLSDVDLDETWLVRPMVLSFNRSMRLPSLIAEKVQPFAVNPISVIGANEDSSISPTIILYDDGTIEAVIPRYAQIIQTLQANGAIPSVPKHKFKVIGWVRESDNDFKTSIKHYCLNYNVQSRGDKPVLDCIADYIMSCRVRVLTSRHVTDIVYKILLHVLDLEGVQHDGNRYSKTSLIKELQINHTVFLQDFKIKVVNICRKIFENNWAESYTYIKELCGSVLLRFGKSEFSGSIRFINANIEVLEAEVMNDREDNLYSINGIDIQIGTIHGSKGETHCSTLYLETFYNKSFESKRLLNQLKGIPIDSRANTIAKQSARMVYVGFSRPTHLLCIAIHQDRIVGHKEQLRNAGWNIDETLVP